MRSAWRILLRPTTHHLPSIQVLSSKKSLFFAIQRDPSQRFFSDTPNHTQIINFFSNKTNPEDFNIEIDHSSLNSVLSSLETRPDIAKKFFNWVSEKTPNLISSETYEIMLKILSLEGKSNEFWDLLGMMKKKGFGLSKNGFLRASEGFEKLNMQGDVEKLKGFYGFNSNENFIVRIVPRLCRILREGDELGDEVWKDVKSFEVDYSDDLVASVLEKLSSYPAKAFLFFRWAIENSSFKPQSKSYNAMARVLGREDCSERFWELLNEMKNSGQGLESETYFKVSRRFLSRGMIKEAVDLFEHAMEHENKPSHRDFLHLMRKIVMGRELELSLVSRTVRIFKDAGFPLKESIFGCVIKSLASVGRLGECSSLLEAMEEGGFSSSNGAVIDRVVVELCRAKKPDEALQFIKGREASGHKFDPKTWISVIQSYYLAGSTEKCLSTFYLMIEKNGGENAGLAFEALVTAHLRKNKVLDVYKVLPAMVEKNKLQPLQTTYKVMIKKLLSEGKLREASSLLSLMKKHGYPPFIEPFFGYISKFGSGEDALMFLKSMTLKAFPSISVFIRTLEGVLKAGRKETADDLLSKSPGFVRNHADVLNLILSHKSTVGRPNPELAPL